MFLEMKGIVIVVTMVIKIRMLDLFNRISRFTEEYHPGKLLAALNG